MSKYDLAIVGMACRLPGARNVEEFWRNLAGGVESIRKLSDDEILASGIPREYLARPNYVKAAAVLDEPGDFDAGFFGYSSIEASTMDPQHRILLELAHEALEDAAYDPTRYFGQIGVFTGAAMNTYFLDRGFKRRFTEEYIPTLIHNDKDFLSTRISYKLNLKGPSITVQTACSTSLVAIHLACQSLLSSETDMALVGAISVKVPHHAGYFSDAGGVMSPDGHVRAFDARANGTVFGSGGAVVVLKRLADAIASGDVVHAVIKGTAVNNDGAEKAGYTAPSINGQANVIVEALANAGLSAGDISYIEAHGSGTPVGDPLEISALTKAFQTFTPERRFCALGSVKTNIGHLDAAAGMAGLIKTVLALKHRALPASLHYSEPNPEADLSITPFYVNTRLTAWNHDGPRRAGVMSTGMGGTNAFVVLEEGPSRTQSTDSQFPSLLVLSARTPKALDAAAARLRDFLNGSGPVHMGDVAYTLQTGRRVFRHRKCVVCVDKDDATAALSENSKRTVTSQTGESRRPVIFLLPGVGDHYVGMAHGLYEYFPLFREQVDRCAEIAAALLRIDIREILYPKNLSWKVRHQGVDLKKMLRKTEPHDAATEPFIKATCVQTVLFTIEYALVNLWRELGVVPDALVGHSMGEYVAACVAGVFTLEDALRLIIRRAQLVEQLPTARMLAVNLAENELLPLLNRDLSISVVNGPSLCVIAGAPSAVQEFERILDKKEILYRSVQNTHAFHSPMLHSIATAFELEVRSVRLAEPNTPYISNVTGSWISKTAAVDPAYWVKHATQTSRFSDALQTMWRIADPIVLEAGPGRTLGLLAMQHRAKSFANSTAIPSLRHDYEHRDDVEFFLHSVGAAWTSGVEINWEKLHAGKQRRRVSLPTYPFERQSFWLDKDVDGPEPVLSNLGTPEKSGIENWFYVPSWSRTPFPQATDVHSDALWLIFSDSRGAERNFETKLRATGSPVQIVRFGSRFCRRSDASFEIDPSAPNDYLALFRELEAGKRGPINILHLGCLIKSTDLQEYDSDDRQNFGFRSLMSIAQAIGELDISVRVKIGVLSKGIHEVTGDELLDPEMATVLGPCGVIPNEFSNISCFNIDLPQGDVLQAPQSEVVSNVLSEFSVVSETSVIAYRGKHRWIKTYQHVSIPTVSQSPNGHGKRLRHRGVYLITGGTGGLGIAIAKFLAETCQARIVLTKRSPFPEKSKWKEFLDARESSVPGNKITQTIRGLLEIERLGGEVEVFVADVADKEQMSNVVNQTVNKFKSIDGVIHAAGVVRPGLIQAKTNESTTSVLWPKVRGTLLLHELLKDHKPDFLVLFSSLASITVPYAHSDYAAANAFLDAFTHYSNSRNDGLHTVTVNWPVWKEVGMLLEMQAMLHFEGWKEEARRHAIATKDGIEAFARVLSCDFTHVVVSPENLDHFIHQSKQNADSLNAVRRKHNSRSRTAARSEPPTDQPTNEIETLIAGIWSDVLGLQYLGIHEQFANLGGHSVLAMQIVSRIRTAYQINVTLRDFFEAPTIAQLSGRVRERIISEIEGLSDAEAEQLASNNRDS